MWETRTIPMVLFDYTPNAGAGGGPVKFLEGSQGLLQADAYSVYDAFFKEARGLVEVGCWMHAQVFLQSVGAGRAAHGSGLCI